MNTCGIWEIRGSSYDMLGTSRYILQHMGICQSDSTLDVDRWQQESKKGPALTVERTTGAGPAGEEPSRLGGMLIAVPSFDVGLSGSRSSRMQMCEWRRSFVAPLNSKRDS
jgi:hypothetical protein